MNKEFTFPDLKLPKFGPNNFLKLISEGVEKNIFEMAKVKLPVDEISDLSSFVAYIYPNFNNKEHERKLIVLGVFTIWTFLLDDELENDCSSERHWIEILERNANPNNEFMLESLYTYIKNELLDDLSDYQKERILPEMINWIKSFKFTGSMRNGNKKYTIEEYIKVRLYDDFFIAEFLTYFIEYLLGIELNSSQVENKLMKEFTEKSLYHLMLTNDVFSYYKDLATKTENFNYVTIVKDVNKFSTMEAMKLIANELDQVMNEVLSLKIKILDSNIGVDERYLNAAINVIYGNAVWSQVCERYQKYRPAPATEQDSNVI